MFEHGSRFPLRTKKFYKYVQSVGGRWWSEMGKWCGIKKKRLIEVWLNPQVRLIMEVMITTWDLGIMHYYKVNINNYH